MLQAKENAIGVATPPTIPLVTPDAYMDLFGNGRIPEYLRENFRLTSGRNVTNDAATCLASRRWRSWIAFALALVAVATLFASAVFSIILSEPEFIDVPARKWYGYWLDRAFPIGMAACLISFISWVCRDEKSVKFASYPENFGYDWRALSTLIGLPRLIDSEDTQAEVKAEVTKVLIRKARADLEEQRNRRGDRNFDPKRGKKLEFEAAAYLAERFRLLVDAPPQLRWKYYYDEAEREIDAERIAAA